MIYCLRCARKTPDGPMRRVASLRGHPRVETKCAPCQGRKSAFVPAAAKPRPKKGLGMSLGQIAMMNSAFRGLR